MLESIILALSPFALNAVMGIVKWLSAMESTAGKRFFLALFSLVGVIALNAMNGTPVDPNQVSSLLQTIMETFIAFIAAHGSYTLFFNKPAAQ